MDKKRLVLLQLTIIAGGLLLFSTGFAQAQLPELAQIKAAAEAGDASAQDKLGAAYYGHFDLRSAAEWFRKAAEQRVPHAQFQLGEILLNGKVKIGESSVANALLLGGSL
jgi:TPR repeat protein